MNQLIATLFAKLLGFLHGLFALALVVFTIYVLGGFGTPRPISGAQVALIYAIVIITWVIIFGFITTIVVMSSTVSDIKEQNRALIAHLSDMALKMGKFPVEFTRAEEVSSQAVEPFIGSGNIRR